MFAIFKRSSSAATPQEMIPVPKTIDAAIELIDLFGQRYAKEVRKKLEKPVQVLFDQSYNVFFEIQKQLLEGNRCYSQVSHPKTFEMLKKFPEAASQLDIFHRLKEKSYSLRPFPQIAFVQNKNLDLDELRRVERQKEEGVVLLCEALESMRAFSKEEEMAIERVYFRGGAVVYNKEIIFFSEIVHLWGMLDHSNLDFQTRMLVQLKPREWVDDRARVIPQLLAFGPERLTFRQFLVRCSLVGIEQHIECPLLPLARSELTAKLIDSESIRSDLSYFLADRQACFRCDFDKLQRPSAPLLRSFQLFFQLSDPILVNHRSSLLSILLHMNEIPECDGLAFRQAWSYLQRSLSAIHQQEVSFINPTPEAEELIHDSLSGELFLFYLKLPKSETFVYFLEELSRLPNFSMTLRDALDFLKAHVNTSVVERSLFIEQYNDVIEILKGNEICLENTKYLFVVPPIPFLGDLVFRERTNRFIEEVMRFAEKGHKDTEFSWMLRQFIFHPQEIKFTLLHHCQEMGVKVSKELLFEVLYKNLEPFELEPPREVYQEAMGLASRIQERYRFTESQIFSIYVEILRLILRGEGALVRKMSQVIHEIANFCPALKNDTIYFLFRYHPQIDPEEIDQFTRLRADWVKNEQLGRFVIDAEQYRPILDTITAFVEPLAAASSQKDGGKFFVEFQRALWSSFFPPLQPIVDFFRVTDVTTDGIAWGEEIWKTHEGQLKMILKQADIGVYFNWAIYNEQPVFFMSFFNVRSRTAHSVFLPVGKTVDEIADISIPFWGLLIVLIQQVLREEAHQNVPKEEDENPDAWVQSFVGAKETLGNFPEVTPQWDFIKQLKLNYRNLFLSAAAGRRLEDFPSYDPLVVASLGHIFPSHPRGSLLPTALLELEIRPEFFIPDASLEFLETFRGRMDRSTPMTDFGLELRTANGSFPISCRVQTVNEFVEINVEGTRNERTPPPSELEGRYMILSIGSEVHLPLRYPSEVIGDQEKFNAYFDFHNLLLKSAYYFSIRKT